MKNLLKTLGWSFVLFLFSSGEGLAQRSDNPLTHPSNYKTRPAGQRAFTATEGTGVVTETTETANYKRPHAKSKTRKVSVETAQHPKRNYKMVYNR